MHQPPHCHLPDGLWGTSHRGQDVAPADAESATYTNTKNVDRERERERERYVR